jgi:hypothetical protein
MASTAIHFTVPPTDVVVVRTSGGSCGLRVSDDFQLWFDSIDDARSTLQAMHAALLHAELEDLTGVTR